MINAKKRDKATAARISLDQLWKAEHELAFQDVKHDIANAMEMFVGQPDDEYVLYVDASRLFYAGFLGAVSKEDLMKPHQESVIRPVAWVSGKFNPAQINYSVSEKEAFAMVASCTKLSVQLYRAF